MTIEQAKAEMNGYADMAVSSRNRSENAKTESGAEQYAKESVIQLDTAAKWAQIVMALKVRPTP